VCALRTGHRSNKSEIYTQLIMSTIETSSNNPQFAEVTKPLREAIPKDVELIHILRVMIHYLHELHQELRLRFIEPAAKAAVHIIADTVKEFAADSWTQYPLVIIAQGSKKMKPRKDAIVSVGSYIAFERLAQTNNFK
jgi:hypothetical protein